MPALGGRLQVQTSARPRSSEGSPLGSILVGMMHRTQAFRQYFAEPEALGTECLGGVSGGGGAGGKAQQANSRKLRATQHWVPSPSNPGGASHATLPGDPVGSSQGPAASLCAHKRIHAGAHKHTPFTHTPLPRTNSNAQCSKATQLDSTCLQWQAEQPGPLRSSFYIKIMPKCLHFV